jgi:hypothetical protein
MRKTVVDWMVDYHAENSLRHTTLFTAVNYLDRALERRMGVSSRNPLAALQRIGFVAFRLACKFEETMWPPIEDYTALLMCSRSRICALEFDLVQLLGWECTVCTSAHVLTRFILASNADILPSRTESGAQGVEAMGYRKKKRVSMLLARYLCELALQEYHMLEFAQSLVAAAAVKLARRTVKVTPLWNPTLAHYTGYTEASLAVCERALLALQTAAPFAERQNAIFSKYAQTRFFGVARMTAAVIDAE